MTSFPKLRLSDWRNIAYHSSYEVIGKRIICTYGKNNHSVELTLEMLRKCFAEIIKSCNIIDIGRRVFIFDNLNIWDDVSEEDLKVHDRKDMKINQLKISLISQGFKIRKSEISAQRITIFLNGLKRIENSIEYNLQREIHCTQFLYNIWQKFPLEIIEIIYCEGEGTPLFKYSIEGKVFKNIVNEKFELEHMVPFIKIDKLEKNLILSDEE